MSLLVVVLASAGWIVRDVRDDVWTYDRTSAAARADWMRINGWEVDLAGGYLALSREHALWDRGPIADDGRVVHEYREIRPPSFATVRGPGIVTTSTRPLPYCELDTMHLAVRSGQWESRWFLRVPLLGIAAICAIPPLIWELRHRRAVKRFAQSRRGLCRACGYDLRESPERCPECGANRPRRWSLIDRLLHAPLTRIRR